ncbi:MAG: alpha/beta hydrolase [Myxococcales bacterium]|nr:alpha/beta hydrolase [Myxococcales bacterium]
MSAQALARRVFTVRTADHWTLDVEWIEPPAGATPRGAALLGHAMMVDRRSLDRPRGGGLASTLATAGWRVFLANLRGRGLDVPRAHEGARWDYDDLVRYDLPALVSAARARARALPLVVVGHSLAGHVSIAAAGCGLYEEPPEAHVLLAANLWERALEPSRWRRARKALALAAIGGAIRLCGRMPARRLGVGPVDEAGDYGRQLACFWRDRWRSRDGLHDYAAGTARVRGSVLAVLGAGDRLLGHPVAARRWANRLLDPPREPGRPPPRRDIWLCGQGTHGLEFDPGHMELASDPRARPLWRAIAAWMTAATGPAN